VIDRLPVTRGCVAGLLSALAGGCLVPQSVVSEDPTEGTNHPPVFDPATDISPREAVICVSSLDPAPREFRLERLRDPDGEPLEARWFIDYDSGFTAIQKTETLVPAEGEPVYPAATFSSIDIDPFHRTTGRPFALEVVISDGFAASDLPPRQRALSEGAYAASYRWTVLYRAGAPCE